MTEVKEVNDESDLFGGSGFGGFKSRLLNSQISEEPDVPKQGSLARAMSRQDSSSSSSGSEPESGEDKAFRQQVLDAHNEKRRLHGVQPLKLDQKVRTNFFGGC